MWAQQLIAPEMFAEVSVPEPGDLAAGEVLLRTLAGGICGSDLPKFRAQKLPAGALPAPPGYPMHEVAGEVLATRDPQLPVGARVVGWATRSDAIAELVVTDGARLARYDDRLEPHTAVLIQSLACVLHAVRRLPVAGAHAAVLGLGPIGLLFAHALRAAGAARVSGVDLVDRSGQAGAFGLDHTVQASSDRWAAGLSAAGRPDLIVEAVGHQVGTLAHAVRAAGPGATILYFGIPDDDIYPLPMELLMRKHLTLIGGVTREHRAMLTLAGEYLHAHPDLGRAVLTDVLPVKRVQEGFDRAVRPAAGRLKIVVTM